MTHTVQVSLPFKWEETSYTLGDFLNMVFSRYEHQEDLLLANIIKDSESEAGNTAIDTDTFLDSLDTPWS